MASLDLSGARIDGELRLTGVQWKETAWLGLRNARASVLHDGGAQPKSLELDGFAYDRIDGVGETNAARPDRKAFRDSYISGWLGRDPTYTPQPYEQLAAVCRRAGEPQWASDVLYASREQLAEGCAGGRSAVWAAAALLRLNPPQVDDRLRARKPLFPACGGSRASRPSERLSCFLGARTRTSLRPIILFTEL